MPTASCPSSGQCWEESGSVIIISSFKCIHLHTSRRSFIPNPFLLVKQYQHTHPFTHVTGAPIPTWQNPFLYEIEVEKKYTNENFSSLNVYLQPQGDHQYVQLSVTFKQVWKKKIFSYIWLLCLVFVLCLLTMVTMYPGKCSSLSTILMYFLEVSVNIC